ncbi:hypothetical protein D3C85_1217180 [compost metagenome]
MSAQIALAQQVRNIHPYRHLDALQCIERQQPQLLVEHIQAHHVLEAAARREGVQPYGLALRRRRSRIDGAQGIPVTAQAVIA